MRCLGVALRTDASLYRYLDAHADPSHSSIIFLSPAISMLIVDRDPGCRSRLTSWTTLSPVACTLALCEAPGPHPVPGLEAIRWSRVRRFRSCIPIRTRIRLLHSSAESIPYLPRNTLSASAPGPCPDNASPYLDWASPRYLETVSSQRLVKFSVTSPRSKMYSGRAMQGAQFRTEPQRPRASFCVAKTESSVASSSV